MKAYVVTGLGFGDEGKGTIVDHLCRTQNATVVVRHNGGPQAAHTVVTAGNRRHVFSQFGAGTLIPGVRTHLSEHMIVNPLNLVNEYDALCHIGEKDALERLSIDRRALIVTPLHTAVNRARELARGADRHGSCGQGVGEARGDDLAGHTSLYAADVFNHGKMLRKLQDIQERKVAEARALGSLGDDATRFLEDPTLPVLLAGEYRSILRRFIVTDDYLGNLVRHGRLWESVIFEGAQGVLLDEMHGFAPYHTWSNTTTGNALAIIDTLPGMAVTRVGVTRCYHTRHGAGPFPTESADLTAQLPDSTNGFSAWQRGFRVGHLDMMLLNYALGVSPVDELAVTCLDRIRGRNDWQIGVGYTKPNGDKLHGLFGCNPSTYADDLANLKPIMVACGTDKKAYTAAFATYLSPHRPPITIWSNGPTAKAKTGPLDNSRPGR